MIQTTYCNVYSLPLAGHMLSLKLAVRLNVLRLCFVYTLQVLLSSEYQGNSRLLEQTDSYVPQSLNHCKFGSD